jgi:perosamine synthetase
MNGRFGAEELDLLEEVITSGDISPYFGNIRGGKFVQELEREFADYVGTEYALALCNGTAALHTAYLAAGFGPGDRVIVPPHTFIATATMVIAVGARPVFSDVLPTTYCLDPNKVEGRLRRGDPIAGIVPVDLLGHPSDMESLHDAAKRKRAVLIEDAAQALGSQYKGKHVGSQFADIAIWSGQATKTWTMGEGGMITTNDRSIFEKSLSISRHGSHYNNAPFISYNFRATELQAAVGLAQLRKFPRTLRQQKAHAKYLIQNLPNCIEAPRVADRANPNWFIIGCTSKSGLNRDSFIAGMEKAGISRGIPGRVISKGYVSPLYDKPVLRDYRSACPTAESLCKIWLWFDIHRWRDSVEFKSDVNRIKELAEHRSDG